MSPFGGGAWTHRHRGVVYDSMAAQARGGTPRDFCRSYGLGIMATFACDRYGDHGATVLAREWCHRMQYFFDVWMHQDKWGYVFTDGDVAGYAPLDDFVDYFLALDLDAPQMERASALNNMRPGVPRYANVEA